MRGRRGRIILETKSLLYFGASDSFVDGPGVIGPAMTGWPERTR